MDIGTIVMAYLTMVVQFSGVVVPVIVYLLSSGMNIYHVTALWLASHTTAVTIAFFATSFIARRIERISSYLEGRIQEAEAYIGTLGLIMGLVLFNFSVWIYIAVPLMVLMRINWKTIYLTVTTGNVLYYIVMVSTIFWVYTLFSSVLITIVLTLAIAFAASIIVYQIFKRINGKRAPEVEKVQA